MDDDVSISVIGGSPIGCILAAHLQQSGYRVTLIEDDAETLNAIRDNGIRIEGARSIETRPFGVIESTGAAAEAGMVFDWIFVCSRTSKMSEIVSGLPLILADEGFAIHFRNGLDTEAPVLEILGPQRCLRGAINYAGNTLAPGRVRMTFFDPPNFIGAAVPGDARAESRARELVEVMNAVGLESMFAGDVRIPVWKTAIRHSAMLPVSALTGMDVAQVMGSPRSLHLIKKLLSEAIEVAARVGFHFDQKFYYDTLTYFLKAGHHMPSMWNDIRKGRPTEIGSLNQKIAEYGELHGVDVPYHRAMSNLVLCIDELNELEGGETD